MSHDPATATVRPRTPVPAPAGVSTMPDDAALAEGVRDLLATAYPGPWHANDAHDCCTVDRTDENGERIILADLGDILASSQAAQVWSSTRLLANARAAHEALLAVLDALLEARPSAEVSTALIHTLAALDGAAHEPAGGEARDA